MTRRIIENVPAEVLQSDLKKYRQLALDLGATAAEIIKTDRVIVDERVRTKCSNPKCAAYGTNANCPPHSPDLDTIRKIVAKYTYALLVYSRFPGENFTDGPSTPKAVKSREQNHEIVGRVEAAAFDDGYYLATGLADGPCRALYCGENDCSVLEGKRCRAPYKARFAMESWGMDVYRMAVQAGWEIYPIGKNAEKSQVPVAAALGLIFIY
jgi:predicted metal-binding protein